MFENTPACLRGHEPRIALEREKIVFLFEVGTVHVGIGLSTLADCLEDAAGQKNVRPLPLPVRRAMREEVKGGADRQLQFLTPVRSTKGEREVFVFLAEDRMLTLGLSQILDCLQLAQYYKCIPQISPFWWMDANAPDDRSAAVVPC